MKQLLVAVIIAVVAGFFLPGCASAPSGICGVQPIGEDENGIAFFRYHCVADK